MVFRFAEEQPPDDYVVDLAEICYSEKHIISGDYIYERWERELVNHLLIVGYKLFTETLETHILC